MEKKGSIPWNKGIPCSKEMKKRISRTLKNKYANGLSIGFHKGHPQYNHALEKWKKNGGIIWNKGLIGKKSHSYGVVFNRARRHKISLALRGNHNRPLRKNKIIKYRKWHHLKYGTSIEKILWGLLNKNGIQFKIQYPFLGRYLADIFVKPNIIIEADGDYWHNIPETIKRDRRRDRKSRKNGYIVIRLRESKIKFDLTACWRRLQPHLVLTTKIK